MNGYMILKIVHITAVVAFLGNIVMGLFWMSRAYYSQNTKIFSFIAKAVIKSDQWITIPSSIIIVASGIWMVGKVDLSLIETGWLFWSLILFSVSGLCFAFRVNPLQNKLYALSAKSLQNQDADLTDIKKDFRRLEVWGLIAISASILSMILMILKLPK